MGGGDKQTLPQIDAVPGPGLGWGSVNIDRINQKGSIRDFDRARCMRSDQRERSPNHNGPDSAKSPRGGRFVAGSAVEDLKLLSLGHSVFEATTNS